jgi:hypothetical protein
MLTAAEALGVPEPGSRRSLNPVRQVDVTKHGFAFGENRVRGVSPVPEKAKLRRNPPELRTGSCGTALQSREGTGLLTRRAGF